MNVSPQPGKHSRPVRKTRMFRADALDMQKPAERQINLEETQELPAVASSDLENTQRHLVAQIKEGYRQIADYQQKSGVVRRVVQKAKQKQWLVFAARVAFTLLLFAFLFKSISWSTLLMTLDRLRHALVLVGFTVGAFALVVSSYQWRGLLHFERIRLDLAKLINLYMVGIAFSHFLPTGMGGDAVKAFYVGRESGNNPGSASAVVMSRVTGFFGMLLMALPSLLIWQGHFARNVALLFLLLSLAVGSMIGGAILATIFLPRLFKGEWARHAIFASAMRIGNALNMSARRPGSLLLATLLGILFWIVSCLNHYSYGLALGINVPLYFYLVAIPLISLAAFLPVSINGYGVREGAFVLVFSTVHVSMASSLLLALLMDAQMLLFGVIGGCIYLTFPVTDKSKITRQQWIA
jgi:uncharacterized protein (TIRG00374 family)